MRVVAWGWLAVGLCAWLLVGCGEDEPVGGGTGGSGASTATGGTTGTGGSGGAAGSGAMGGQGGSGGESNVYEVPIELPSCAPAPDVRTISSSADWDDINDPQYRVFCVHPGDYRDADTIQLTADGTAGSERWIRWYDPDAPDDTSSHPATMDESRRAIVRQLRLGDDGDPANHWRIDRLTVRDAPYANSISRDSADNVLNRLLIEQCNGHMVTFSDGARDNTLQNSVVRETEMIADTDRTCINLASGQVGTRIVANEIYDCSGDGIQFSPNTGYAYVENNDIYLTDARYSDCQGTLTTSGECACAENAIDFKSPRDRQWLLPPEEWARIERNRMWGFRPTDTGCGGTGSPGTALHIGSGAENAVDFVLVRANVVMDSPIGIGFGVSPVHNVSIVGNLLYDITHARDGNIGPAITNLGDDFVEMYLNTVIDSDYWFRNGPNADSNDLRCNIAIRSHGRPFSGVEWGTDCTADYNFFYDNEAYTTESPSHDLSFATAEEAQHEDYCFTRRRWTGPEQICIPHGTPTPASPHWDACDPDLGARPGIGVDDATSTALGTWLGL